jgi:hypothetical protein
MDALCPTLQLAPRYAIIRRRVFERLRGLVGPVLVLTAGSRSGDPQTIGY